MKLLNPLRRYQSISKCRLSHIQPREFLSTTVKNFLTSTGQLAKRNSECRRLQNCVNDFQTEGCDLFKKIFLIFLRYEDVYAKLFMKFDWNRLAALTEDGMKYTQYISDMETTLKEKGINLMVNKKFTRVNDKDRQLENFKTVSARKKHFYIIKPPTKSLVSSQVSQRAPSQPDAC